MHSFLPAAGDDGAAGQLPYNRDIEGVHTNRNTRTSTRRLIS